MDLDPSVAAAMAAHKAAMTAACDAFSAGDKAASVAAADKAWTMAHVWSMRAGAWYASDPTNVTARRASAQADSGVWNALALGGGGGR